MTKVKKNKMKTHKGMKKVFRAIKSGSIAMSSQGVLHNTGKRSAKTNRQKRSNSALSKADYSRIKDLV